jgi:hypothetical protein
MAASPVAPQRPCLRGVRSPGLLAAHFRQGRVGGAWADRAMTAPRHLMPMPWPDFHFIFSELAMSVKSAKIF